MDSNNLDEQNIKSMSAETPGGRGAAESPTLEKPKAVEASNKKVGLLVGLGASALVLIAIIISVVMMTMILQNNKPGGGTSIVDGDDESSETALGVTELTSGSVTATIGEKSVTYKAKYVVDGVAAVVEAGTYESTNDDEVVFLVINGGTLSLENGVVINKSGSANFDGRGDDYSFYGTNSAVVAVGEGSQIGMAEVTINTSVDGANAVVATDSASVVFSDVTISTTGDASRGLHATYGGKIVGNGGSITTKGQSCASLATDRGAGTVSVTGMTLSTAGAGSPLIYSTGEITVSSSTGTATGAQIAVVEGKNSIELTDCDFSAIGIGNRIPSGAHYPIDNAAVMIYQSMSGDASMGVGSFKATDCTLTVTPDTELYAMTPFFFVTNTEAEILLSNVTANFYEDEYFVLAAGTDEWGKSSSNGGVVTITATNLTASNTNIGVDEISSVNGI